MAFQRLIICVYEQVPRDIDVLCVRTQIFQKMLFDLPTSTMDVILPGLETPIDLPIIVIRSLPR